jgi:NADP-dependent 3-hydroxy acid dehydrogenase YdfG
MKNIDDMVIVITGSSSGIGEDAARSLAARGAKLMLGARREDRLASLVDSIRSDGGTADYLVTDVTIREQVQALAQSAVEKYGKIDVLINNAGVMPLSFLAQCKVDEWDRMVDVNIKGVLYGIAAVLPGMHSRKSGHIINIASIAGYNVAPTTAVYSGTKFAVRAISDGLRQESQFGLRTTVISPGPVTTELTSTISDERVAKNIEKMYETAAIDASAISRAIIYAIEQPDDVDVTEIVVRPVAP